MFPPYFLLGQKYVALLKKMTAEWYKAVCNNFFLSNSHQLRNKGLYIIEAAHGLIQIQIASKHNMMTCCVGDK